MNKKSFLLSLLCISLVSSNAHARITSSDVCDWTMRALYIGCLASVANNFIHQEQKVQDMIDSQKSNIIDTLSPGSKEWIRGILREQGIQEEVVQTIQLVSGLQEKGGEHLAAGAIGSRCAYLNLHQEYARMLNDLLEKEILTSAESQTLNVFRFLIGHESIHIKKYYDKSFSMAKGHQVLSSMTGLLTAGCTYELLRFNNFSRTSSALVSLIPVVLGGLYAVRFILNEERECDLCASENPEVVKAGAEFFPRLKPMMTARFNQEAGGKMSAQELDNFYNEYKTLIGIMTLHPHPEDRAAYLRARAQELECAQATAQAA